MPDRGRAPPKLAHFFELAARTPQDVLHTHDAAVFGRQKCRVQNDVLDVAAGQVEFAREVSVVDVG